MEKRVKVALAFVVVAWIVALIVLVQIYGGSAPGAPPAAVTVSAVPVPQQPEPGSSPGVSRLDVRFSDGCSVGWQERQAPFGDGRPGVNTVFRSAARQSMTDSNILDLYFFNRSSGRASPPAVPQGADYVWAVEAHDIADHYRYRADGVRVCWRIREQ